MTTSNGNFVTGDLYGPFWSLEFFADSLSLQQAKPDLVRTSQSGEAKTLDLTRVGALFDHFDSTNAADLKLTKLRGNLARGESREQGAIRSFRLDLYKSEMVVKLAGEAATFDLTLSPPYNDALMILDHRVLQRGMLALCEWGYIDSRGKITARSGKYAFLVSRPSMSFSADGISVTMSGTDVLSYVAGRTIRKGKKWDRKGKSDADILKEIATEIGYKVDFTHVQPSADGALTKGGGLHSLWRKGKTPTELEQHDSDWQFFKFLAFQNGCQAIIGPCDETTGKPVVEVFDVDIARKKFGTPYTLKAYQQLTEKNDVPLLSFESQPNANIFSPPGSQGIDTRQPDLAKGTTEQTTKDVTRDARYTVPKGQVGAGAIKEAGRTKLCGRAQVKSAVKTEDRGSPTISVVARDSNAQGMVREISRIEASRSNVQASATIPGLPRLTPQKNVDIRGLGKSMSGSYKIVTMEHHIGTDGYECNLALIRERLTSDTAPGTNKTIGPKPTDRDLRKEKDKVIPTNLEAERSSRRILGGGGSA